jgi:hypothetical protein
VELAQILHAARSRWRAGGRPVVAAVAALVAVVCTALYRWPTSHYLICRAGAVRASLPLPVELSRLPLSVFLPTPELPLVAAVGQLLVVVGLAELLLGRVRTVALAVLAHSVATLSARLLIQFGPATVVGLTRGEAHLLDTGPSVITAALGSYLLLSYRARRCLIVLAGGLFLAAEMQNNIDGREHFVALLCGTVAPIAVRREWLVLTALSRSVRRSWRSWVPVVGRPRGETV